jgi:aspartate/methionine/tyrosine aminotransferase
LDESKGWDIDLLELERVYANLEKDHKKPKAIIITNPGNPTGTTLSYQTIANFL